MGAPTIDVNLNHPKRRESLVPNLVVNRQIDAPRAGCALLAQVHPRVPIVQIVIPRIEQLPVDEVVGALEAPREQDVALRLAIPQRVARW